MRTSEIINAYNRNTYFKDTRPLLPVKLERLKFAKGFKPAWKVLRQDLDKHLTRRKAKDRQRINRTLKLIIGNFVFSYFERRPLSIPNKGDLYLPGTRLAKLYITREATRAVVYALLAEGYIKLNRKGTKATQQVNNYVATDKLAGILVPLVYSTKKRRIQR